MTRAEVPGAPEPGEQAGPGAVQGGGGDGVVPASPEGGAVPASRPGGAVPVRPWRRNLALLTRGPGEVVLVIVVALIVAVVVKTFLMQAFFIPSESMENTLLTGDRVLVSKLTPGAFPLHRGDIVVFKDPGGWLGPAAPVDQGPLRNGIRDVLTFIGLLPQDSGEHLIKRVIGVPGDKVMCCDAKGRVEVNGVPIDEPYIFPGDVPSSSPFSETVPAGSLWVMGDHRGFSEDSRAHLALNHGMVPISDVVGKAFVIVWPLDRAGGLGIPDSVFGRVPAPASTP